MTVPGPVPGPCVPWADADDVAACCSAIDPMADSWAPGWTVDDLAEDAALKASMLLFELSGRQFTGLCERTVRPCRDACRCSWTRSVAPSYLWSESGLSWHDECGDRCGCGSLSRVKLPGYPVREIDEVKVDGEVVDPDSYRLDGWRWLTRLDDPGPPLVKRRWPACQNLALNDDQAGTFSVTYAHGIEPPLIGVQAVAELACQLFKACATAGGTGENVLPVGVARITRQGVELEQGLLTQFLYAAKPSGLVAVDGFLTAYGTQGRRAVVWSPDMASYARRVGT